MSRPSKSPVSPDLAEDASARKVRLFLGLVCFFAGAAIMVVEISAFRLLAPYFGNTIYTSTALIGVILVAFSVGGYLGGRLADKHPALGLIGWLLAGASVLTLFIPGLHSVFSDWVSNSLGVINGPLVISLILFALPGILLGAVSPASVRFYSLTQKDTHVGVAAGTISMLGSLGSFVGTFASGFFLISTFGVRNIFLGAGLVLLLLALASFWLGRSTSKPQVPVSVAALIAAIIGLTAEKPVLQGVTVLHERESVYHHITVYESGPEQRLLALDSTQEGGMNPKTGGLILAYQEYWKLALLREPAEVRSALFIGAGAFGMPENVSRDFPQATVDVVEIDPEVIDVGRKFFRLDEHPNVNAHAADARRFLSLSGERKWDMIFGDAYNGQHAIPSHLATREFFQLIADHLEPKGVYIMNIIASITGPKAELSGGMLATLRQVFPYVETFDAAALSDFLRPPPSSRERNIILLAAKEDLRPLVVDHYVAPNSWQQKMLKTRLPSGSFPRSEYVFSDDYNPVDAIIARGLLE